jgi:ferrous iron transport protein B
VLHPVAGSLLFVAVMVTFFQLIFAWATPGDGRDRRGDPRHRDLAARDLPPGLVVDFLADGLVAGVGAVIAFVPQIALLFGSSTCSRTSAISRAPHSSSTG